MIDLDSLMVSIESLHKKGGRVITIDADALHELMGEIKSLREQVRLLTERPTEKQPAPLSSFHLYRHRSRTDQSIRLLSYNLTTGKYHVEFYDGSGAPRHLNGFLEFAEVQENYDMLNPVPTFYSPELAKGHDEV